MLQPLHPCWQEKEWTLSVPIKVSDHMTEDDFRLAVAPDSFNLHVRGQEEAPLLAGETSRRLDPTGSSWRLSAVRMDGTQRVRSIEVTLKKAEAIYWREDLIAKALV